MFVHDRATGTTSLISVGLTGLSGSGASALPSITADGRFVAFCSSASDLVPGDTFDFDVFVRDRQTGSTTKVGPCVSAGPPALSGDGRWVAFSTYVAVIPGDTNGSLDVYLYDRQTGVTTKVSTGPGGLQGNENSFAPAISSDGRWIAFASVASNLVSGDTNGMTDIFVSA